MRRLFVFGAVCAIIATGCATGGSTANVPGQFNRVGQRVLTVSVTGGAPYSVAGAPNTSGSIAVAYTNSNTIAKIEGSVTYPGAVSGTATFALSLAAAGGGYNGYVSVSDSGSSVNASANASGVSVNFDGDGDASGSISQGATTIAWAIDTVAFSVADARYQTLTDDESAWCQDSQQRLAGLDPVQVPLASITNVDHASRSDFGASKASLTPFTVHTFREAGQFDTADGENIAITRAISCKNRAEDHVATTGVTTGGNDLECKVQNQHALDLALAQLTPAELANFTANGRPLVFANDVVHQTGTEWLNPINDVVVVGGNTVVTAHALSTRWTDPTYQIFPDTIRGVHYCTGMAPAWFLWYLTEGAF